MQAKTLTFDEIARQAGFEPAADGRFNLPATQETTDAIAQAAKTLTDWQPGQPAQDVTVTGAGPVWAWMSIGHALHGTVARLRYVAPNAPEPLTIFDHGVATE